MTTRSVLHGTFSLERHYRVPPEKVFAAWADPQAKARWFAGPGAEHELDFRVGGREAIRARHPGGPPLTVEALYRDIVPGERIVYTSALSADGTLATVSLTTVEFESADAGTRLVLTEQGTYLDGHEDPAWREQGTGQWLDALGTELGGTGPAQSR